jgi:5'-nucleotidase
MTENKPQILLTNDDGIHSPGLWAAAEALESLGFVHVVAPLYQQTAAGHSMPSNSSGIIETLSLQINGRDWTVYAVDGSPGQAVLHGVFDVIKHKPDLVVSGINYGENVGATLTVSGTVGAALQAATLGIPALAVSLQTKQEYHLSHSRDIDFDVAAFFTQKFAKLLLETRLPFDVEILKIDVPADATRDTPWVLTRQSRERYYINIMAERSELSDPGPISYKIDCDPERLEPNGDIRAVAIDKKVSVTPISFDMTSRVDFTMLMNMLEEGLA